MDVGFYVMTKQLRSFVSRELGQRVVDMFAFRLAFMIAFLFWQLCATQFLCFETYIFERVCPHARVCVCEYVFVCVYVCVCVCLPGTFQGNVAPHLI